MDNKLYKIVLDAAKKAVLNKWLRISFDDLVNDAYIEIVDRGLEVNSENWIKSINNIARGYLNNYSDRNEIEVNSLQTSFCRCCKEDKPIAAFGITVRKKTGKKVVQTYCSECQRLKMIAYRRSKGVKEQAPTFIYEYPPNCVTSKQKQAYRHKIWQRKNIEKVYSYRKKNGYKM